MTTQKVTYLKKPVAQLRAKLKSTLYVYENGEYTRTPQYLNIGETATLYELVGEYGNIGNGLFVKEVDAAHFDISYGELTIEGDNVHTCSINGVEKRRLQKGQVLNIIEVIPTSKSVLFKINHKEFLSSTQAIALRKSYDV